MATFHAQDPNFEARVRGNFARQSLNRTIGASLAGVTPGKVEIVLPFRDDLCQQHGFVGAGIVAAIADIACGYAAMSLWGADADGLTVEFKINFLAPARGDRLIARGRVTRPGRTLSVCSGEVFTTSDGEEWLVATMLATIMVVRPDRLDSQVEDRSRRGGQHPRPSTHATGHSGRKSRPWCLCRGGGLRQTLRELAGIGR